MVSLAYLLNYANTKELLSIFVKNALYLLKPGGKLFGINASMQDVESVFTKCYTDEEINEILMKSGVCPKILRLPIEEGDKLEVIK